jgi:hypothetical protein
LNCISVSSLRDSRVRVLVGPEPGPLPVPVDAYCARFLAARPLGREEGRPGHWGRCCAVCRLKRQIALEGTGERSLFR